MSVNVKNINLVYEGDDISHIVCRLSDNTFFDVEIYDFYYWLTEIDRELNTYSLKFDNWTLLTEDLYSLSYDFSSKCESYITTLFTPEEIVEFTYS